MKIIYRLHYRIVDTLTWAKYEYDAPTDERAIEIGYEYMAKWKAQAAYIEKHEISVLEVLEG